MLYTYDGLTYDELLQKIKNCPRKLSLYLSMGNIMKKHFIYELFFIATYYSPYNIIYCLPKYFNKKIFLQAINSDPTILDRIMNSANTNKNKLHSYLNKSLCKYVIDFNPILFHHLKEKHGTRSVCKFFIKRMLSDPECAKILYLLRYVPSQFLNKKTCLELSKYKNNQFLTYIPVEFCTKKICLESYKNNGLEIIQYIVPLSIKLYILDYHVKSNNSQNNRSYLSPYLIFEYILMKTKKKVKKIIYNILANDVFTEVDNFTKTNNYIKSQINVYLKKSVEKYVGKLCGFNQQYYINGSYENLQQFYTNDKLNEIISKCEEELFFLFK